MKIFDELGIEFKNKKLLETAFTHSSFSHENEVTSYERLEFLGDAVLELVMSDYLYKNTNLPEGLMSKKRSEYVCESALYEYSIELEFNDLIKIGNGVEQPNKAVLADVFESVIGVVYLEYGLEKVKELFNKIVVPHIENQTMFFGDYKSILQELVQTDKKTLVYKLSKETGPAHNKIFEVKVFVDGILFGIGKGHSKKEAEQNAAEEAISKQAK